jgi:hypothetical protein
MNLYEVIEHEMATDDQDTWKISVKLYKRYEDATEEGKKIIDDFLITLTGWSMAGLLERKEELTNLS